jgi:hypothetical protein
MRKFSGYSSTATRRAAEARTAGANERAAKLGPIIKALQTEGITSLSGIAAALDKRRVPTPLGRGHWYATQVRRVFPASTKIIKACGTWKPPADVTARKPLSRTWIERF